MKQIYNSETKIQLTNTGVPMQIIMITPEFSEMPPEPDAPPRFTGNCHVTKTDRHGKVIGQIPFTFPIEANNLQEAFDKFEETGQAALDRAAEESKNQKPGVITPG